MIGISYIENVASVLLWELLSCEWPSSAKRQNLSSFTTIFKKKFQWNKMKQKWKKTNHIQYLKNITFAY